MAFEVKQAKTTEAKIADRLKPSGGEGADHHSVHGTGERRTHHYIYNAGHAVDPATAAKPTTGRVARHPDTEVQGGAASAVGSGPQGRDVISRGGR
jgi:hypothetical protein